MKTTYSSTPYQNVTNNERLFRGVFGTGLLTAVVAGAIVSPITIFTASMTAVYLVMTATMGSDPLYLALNSISKASSPKRHSFVNNLAWKTD